MKLSEAIREGAQKRPQKYGPPCPGDERSCAVVAALEAATGSLDKGVRAYNGGRDVKLLPALTMPAVPCPARGCPIDGSGTLEGLIYHLNDTHKWKRERIADFVEQLESVNP